MKSIHYFLRSKSSFIQFFFCETEAHIYNKACQKFDMKFETLNAAASAESV